MKEYATKEEFIEEIRRTADLFIGEYADIPEDAMKLRMEEDARTPYENLAYQLGWMALVQKWEHEEQTGNTPTLPAPGVKWNQTSLLHNQFYAAYGRFDKEELENLFAKSVNDICNWLETFNDEELFQPGGRNWAQSTSSNWPVWRWVNTNTVAPFTNFRKAVRKWKKLYAQEQEK